MYQAKHNLIVIKRFCSSQLNIHFCNIMMKKKRLIVDSDTEDSLDLYTLRDKKMKVMSKSMAEEIDAEAEVDSAIGLQVGDIDEKTTVTPKINLREIDLERALYRWYERYQEQRKDLKGEESSLQTDQLITKAKSLLHKLGGSADLMEQVTKSWICRWQERYGVPKVLDNQDCASTSNDSIDIPELSGEKLEEPMGEKIGCLEPIKQRLKNKRKVLSDDSDVVNTPESSDFRQVLTIDTSWGTSESTEPSRNRTVSSIFREYAHDQVYFAFCFQLDWKSLPDKTLETHKEDPVWLLMAGNATGRHRTRILVTGRHWRPGCLRHVNMLSQPVVYAGGGNGAVSSDLLSWWFHREFIPAAESINPRAVLVASDDFNLRSEDCVSSDGSVRLIIVNKETVDWGLIKAEFRTRYTTHLLRSLSHSDTTSISDGLNSITLKEVFPLFHKSWLSLRTETFERCWTFSRKNPSSEAISANLIQAALSGDLINLSSAKEDDPKVPRLSLTLRSDVKIGHSQEDRMLLLELQWLAHDLGLEVTDDDLSSWALEPKPEPIHVKAEPSEEDPGDKEVPTASQAAGLLSRVLLWMETLPLEPNLLMVVRDIIDVAKQASKMGLGPPHPGAALPFFCHNGDHLTQPPPAHMGIPPYQLDPKGASAMGFSRPPMYPFSAGGAYPYPMLSPEISQVAASWHTPGMYPISAGAAGFRSPYPSGLPITSTTLPSEFYRISPTGFLPGHPGLSPHGPHSLPSHPAIITPGPKQELGHHTQADHNHRSSSLDKNSTSTHHSSQDSKNQDSGSQNDKKKPHIKKPLNAFMLYMKEMRAKVVAECTLKESAAINQILGRRWHSLTREEQAKYYEKARSERQLHMQLYPGWSARDNYGYGTKKRKRKKDRPPNISSSLGGIGPKESNLLVAPWHALGREEQAKYYELARRERQLHMQLYPDWSSRANSSRGKKRKRKQEANDGGNNMKKCRARYGLDQQSQWCKPCRRKKKCIRYMEGEADRDGNQSEDNIGSCGSVGDATTPPDDDDGAESLMGQSLSSPGGLSGLSSLTSPSMILPSPSTSLASPSVSLASPCMSLQSPLTPPTFDMKPIIPIPLPPLHRNPVGTNPHDVNNPLSVNQLTGKCIKSEPKERSRAISVT